MSTSLRDKINRVIQEEMVQVYPAITEKVQPKKTIKSVLDPFLAKHGYTMADVIKRDQHYPLIHIRKEAIRLVKSEFPNISSPTLAKIFKRDHTTVLNALGRLKKNKDGRYVGGRSYGDYELAYEED